MLFPKFIYKVKKIIKILGDIKCVEVKSVFLYKTWRKKNTDKNGKVVILSAQLLNLYQKGGVGGGGGMTC